MDSFAPVKSPVSRRHPEDTPDASDIDSDVETSSPNTNKDEAYEIPGTGSKDMPLFKTSTQLTGSFNTGVKGVIADAHSYEAARRQTRTQKRTSDYSFISQLEADLRAPFAHNNNNDADYGCDDSEFLKTWRKNRLVELQKGQAVTRRRSPSKRKYGRVERVDAAGYLDAVEKISGETIVVVTIYSDESEESKFVEDCLNTLSRRYATTRFVKLHHAEAEMDAAVVPAVLAYKGGNLFANIMRIVDEIPPGRNLSSESLELVLRRANVLHKE